MQSHCPHPSFPISLPSRSEAVIFAFSTGESILIDLQISEMITAFSVLILRTNLCLNKVVRKQNQWKHDAFFFSFNWGIVVLQCCVSFYRTVKFPVLYSRFLLVTYFIHISVYMSIPISQFVLFFFP